MQPSFLPQAADWLTLAEFDLITAEASLQHDPMVLGSVAHHAQQSVEKGLKGFLTAYGQPFAKTHDLDDLIMACGLIEPTFLLHRSAAQTLTPYATRFRYPMVGMPLQPIETDAREALRLARETVEFVRQALFPGSP